MRRTLGVSSLGHWGTLDPAACGVLVLAAGSAARLIPYLPFSDKRYVFELRAGSETETGDATGRVVRSAALPPGWAASIESVAASFVGALEQTPPMFSAVKVGGKPLYKAARAGRSVRRQPKQIRIHSLRVIEVYGAFARLEVHCSAGTYVRTLCEQVGERLGVPAHMGMLLRTQAGPFALAGSRTPAEIERAPDACLIDPLSVLTLERVELDAERAARFAHGNSVSIDGELLSALRDRHVLALRGDVLLGVGLVADQLAPVRVLQPAAENL